MLNYNKIKPIISVIQWFLRSCSWSGALLLRPIKNHTRNNDSDALLMISYRRLKGAMSSFINKTANTALPELSLYLMNEFG